MPVFEMTNRGASDEKQLYEVDQLENIDSDQEHHASEKITRLQEIESEFTPEEQRKIIHRIDRRLIITVGVMYCVSLMDRTNLSAASIAGMTEDLVLIGFRYVSLPERALLQQRVLMSSYSPSSL